MDVTSLTSQLSTESAATQAQEQLNMDLNNFLLLLTAQISNQDPLEPMDSTTFVSQLAQLSQVEQAITTNTNLENLSQQLASYGEFSDVQLIGREVVLASSTLDLSSGQAQIQYELAGTAEQVTINIMGLDGTVIREITNLSEAAGVRQTVNWDGLTDDGLQAADGAYTFEVVAINSDNNSVSYQSFAVTYVEELAFRNGEPMLLLRNDQEVSSAEILSVR